MSLPSTVKGKSYFMMKFCSHTIYKSDRQKYQGECQEHYGMEIMTETELQVSLERISSNISKFLFLHENKCHRTKLVISLRQY